MDLAIIIAATHSFQYALLPQARAIRDNLALAGITAGNLILVTDKNPVAGVIERYRAILENFTIYNVPLPVVEGAKKDYGVNAQLLIAQMYSAGFDIARKIKTSHVWTLEADVIPEANNLRCMVNALDLDGGYYSVAFCPYVSAGGGGIMGGRGNPANWIAQNWTEEERIVPEELDKRHKAFLESWNAGDRSAERLKERDELAEELKKCGPKANVYTLNGQRWRQRGWLEWAYPAIGKGAIVPSDWFPMGNNLFNKAAIELVNFNGYTGRGTQDLWLCYKLAGYGLRFAVIPHAVSSHVVRKVNSDGGPYTMYRLYHETQGDCAGHLRTQELPFYTLEPGEGLPEAQAALTAGDGI